MPDAVTAAKYRPGCSCTVSEAAAVFVGLADAITLPSAEYSVSAMSRLLPGVCTGLANGDATNTAWPSPASMANMSTSVDCSKTPHVDTLLPGASTVAVAMVLPTSSGR